jgi:hypothetical protein
MDQKNETPLAATGGVSCNQLGGWLRENLNLSARRAQHLLASYGSASQLTMADASSACRMVCPGLAPISRDAGMNASEMISLDEIRTFLGPIPPEEYERRHKLRSYRNTATAMIGATHSDTARALAWHVIEWASPNLYAPAPLEWLDLLNLLASRLLKTAQTAEELDRLIQEASREE